MHDLFAPRHAPIAHDTNREFDERLTFGQRVADRVAAFGGSWTFIGLFFFVLLGWIGLNSWWVAARFDPFPYILLNLLLSMIAALQAPVIMMSQNRQAAKDRLDAGHDYEVNLKAELEIAALHEKWDHLVRHEWTQLLEMQQKQLELLATLVDRLTK